VVKIDRIQSMSLWRNFEIKTSTMATIHPWPPLERKFKWLFHGTNPSSIAEIVEEGFDLKLAGQHGDTYGKGIYFAREASHSMRFSTPNDKGNRQMLLCRVAVGVWCQGYKGFSKKSIGLLESTADNPADPKIFAVYDEAQIYPEYVVTFECNNS